MFKIIFRKNNRLNISQSVKFDINTEFNDNRIISRKFEEFYSTNNKY